MNKFVAIALGDDYCKCESCVITVETMLERVFAEMKKDGSDE